MGQPPQPGFQDPFLCGGCHLALNGVGQTTRTCQLGDPPPRLPAVQTLFHHEVRVAPVLRVRVRGTAIQTKSFIRGSVWLYAAEAAPPLLPEASL